MLDVGTLVTLAAAAAALLLLLGQFGLDREWRTPGLRAWALGLACTCGAMLVAMLRTMLPYPVFLLGLTVTVLLPVFHHRALDSTLGQGRGFRVAIGVAVVVAALLIGGNVAGVSTDVRATVVGAYFLGMYGWLTVRSAIAHQRLQLRALLWLAFTFAIMGAVFGWRVYVVQTVGLQGSHPLSQTPLNIATYLGVLQLLMVGTLAFTLLEMSLLQRRLREAAIKDDLTGLLNRRGFEPLVEAASRHRRRTGRPFCAVVFDIDRFKQVNDQRGHAVGDAALRHVADVLVQGLRPSDAIARVGGEEFVALLIDTPLASAVAAAERLREAVEAAPLLIEGGETIRLTLSAGVAQADGDDWEPLFDRADHALYRAKQDGRNRVVSAGGG